MKNASGHQGKNKRQRKQSEQEHIQHFLRKTSHQEVSGSFTLYIVVQNNGKEMYIKSVLHVQSCFFAN